VVVVAAAAAVVVVLVVRRISRRRNIIEVAKLMEYVDGKEDPLIQLSERTDTTLTSVADSSKP
jgi:DNA invertase Pin-like site-specific DNA recombinase